MNSKRAIFAFISLTFKLYSQNLNLTIFSNLTWQSFRNIRFFTKKFTLSSNIIFFEIEIYANINFYKYI